MKQKAAAAVLCLGLLLGLLSGCASLVEGERTTVTAHRAGVSDGDRLNATVHEVKNYEELREAVIDFVREREEYGLIRFVTYDGIVEADVSEACMEVSYDTPLGAYAVYYMTSSVNKIVSYYEAEMFITYKKTARQIGGIVTANTERKIQSSVTAALEEYADDLALLSDETEITRESIAAFIDRVYREDAGLIVCRPEVSVSFYPETSVERIIDIQFQYPYPRSTLQKMEELLAAKAEETVGETDGQEEAQRLFALFQSLAGEAAYIDAPAESAGTGGLGLYCTAYGALITGKANSEGFAMAYKLFCELLGVHAYAVEGRRDNLAHWWNIVKIGDFYYHVDASAGVDGHIFAADDLQMADRYWWKAEQYPECRGPLDYAEFDA